MDHVPPRLNRRDALRIIGLSALVAPLALRASRDVASAASAWCYRDPIFSIDGKVGHVYLAVPNDLEISSRSACQVVIYHPPGAVTEMIWIDPVGFGSGITASFKSADHLVRTSAGNQVEVGAKVKLIGESIPAMVLFAPAPGKRVTESALGVSNAWIVLSGVVL